MSDNQPKNIPVKKADGTVEMVTFAELQKRQAAAKSAPPAPAPAPARPNPRPAAPLMPKKRDDFHAALAEPLTGVSALAPVTSDSRLPEVEKVFKKLRFTAPRADRLKNIIQARLKGVREEEATRQKLSAPVNQGGAGLKPDQTEEVLKLCRLVMGQKAAGDPGLIQPIKPTMASHPAPSASPAASVKHAPGKMFVEQRSLSGPVDNIADLIKKNSTPTAPAAPPVPVRPLMRDVAPVRADGVGPVDEVGNFTLADFRRLSAKTTEAAARLKQKFLVLQEESYLFYIKALAAWRQSPLYLAYAEKLAAALNTKTPLAEVLTSPEEINLTEIRALLAMEKELN